MLAGAMAMRVDVIVKVMDYPARAVSCVDVSGPLALIGHRFGPELSKRSLYCGSCVSPHATEVAVLLPARGVGRFRLTIH